MRALDAVAELNRDGAGTAHHHDRRCTPTRTRRRGSCGRRTRRSRLGPATYVDPATASAKSAYLDEERVDRLLLRGAGGRGLGRLGVRRRARRRSPSGASRPGSPSSGRAATTIRRLGDKMAAKRLAEKRRRAGRAVERRPRRRPPSDAAQHADRLGLPGHAQGGSPAAAGAVSGSSREPRRPAAALRRGARRSRARLR